jgi:hypothetical protein
MEDPAPTARTGPSCSDSHSTSVQDTWSCCMTDGRPLHATQDSLFHAPDATAQQVSAACAWLMRCHSAVSAACAWLMRCHSAVTRRLLPKSRAAKMANSRNVTEIL